MLGRSGSNLQGRIRVVSSEVPLGQPLVTYIQLRTRVSSVAGCGEKSKLLHLRHHGHTEREQTSLTLS